MCEHRRTRHEVISESALCLTSPRFAALNRPSPKGEGQGQGGLVVSLSPRRGTACGASRVRLGIFTNCEIGSCLAPTDNNLIGHPLYRVPTSKRCLCRDAIHCVRCFQYDFTSYRRALPRLVSSEGHDLSQASNFRQNHQLPPLKFRRADIGFLADIGYYELVRFF